MAKEKVTTGRAGVSGVTGWISGVASTIGVDRVTNVIGGAVEGAARTKATVDRNIEGLMSLASLPTKSDYRRLLTKLESLQGNLVNVSRKLDKLSADMASMNGHKRPPAASKSPKSSKSRKSSKPARSSASGKRRSR